MNIIKSDLVVYNVFEAVDCGGYLEVGKRLSLEYLSQDDSGIFETCKSWQAFIRGNFYCPYDKGSLIGEIKETTLKKWCYPQDQYIDKFVVAIGGGNFLNVNKDNILLSFEYELFYSKGSSFPCSVEIYVTARTK